MEDTRNIIPSAIGTIVEAIPENTELRLAYLDRDFRYVWTNKSFAREMGFDIRELIGKNHFDLFHNEQHRALIRRVIGTGEEGMLRDIPLSYLFNRNELPPIGT